jgi:hypothetical protein
MKTLSVKPQKVQVTTNITKLAQDTMLDHGYCGVRGMGQFLSDLVMDYHAKRTRQLTQAEIAAELHRLANLLEGVNPVAPIASEPMPLVNVIPAPSCLVGATVLSEEPGKE